jgi:amino acid transporter
MALFYAGCKYNKILLLFFCFFPASLVLSFLHCGRQRWSSSSAFFWAAAAAEKQSKDGDGQSCFCALLLHTQQRKSHSSSFFFFFFFFFFLLSSSSSSSFFFFFFFSKLSVFFLTQNSFSLFSKKEAKERISARVWNLSV